MPQPPAKPQPQSKPQIQPPSMQPPPAYAHGFSSTAPLFTSEAEARQKAQLEIEASGGQDAVLLYPLAHEETPAGAATGSGGMTQDQRVFYEDLGQSGKPLGAHIGALLAHSPPRERPAWVLRQLEQWLQKMTYFQCKARLRCVPRLAAVASVRTVRAGEIILRQGERTACFYILLTGECSVHLNTLNPPQPRWRADQDDDDDSDGADSAVANDTFVASGRKLHARGHATRATTSAVSSLLAMSIASKAHELTAAAGSLPPTSPSKVPYRLPSPRLHERCNTDGRPVAMQSVQQAHVNASAGIGKVPNGAAPAPSPPSQRGGAPSMLDSILDNESSQVEHRVDPQVLSAKHGAVIRILKPGDAFGEFGCLIDSACCGTMVANESCKLVVLKRKHVDCLYGPGPSLSDRLRFLRSLQLPLPPKHTLAFHEQRVDKGGIILSWREPLERFAVVWSGSVSLRAPVRHPSGELNGAKASSRSVAEGHGVPMQELSIVCPGGILGDELLLASASARGGRPSSASAVHADFEAVAREDTRLLVISRQDVPRLPVKTMQAFTEAARRRHDYHSSLHAFKVSKASKSSGAPSSDALGQRQPSSSRLASPMQARSQSPPAPVAPQSEPLPELPLPFMMAGGLGGPIGVSYAEKRGHEQDDQGQVELRTNKEVERDGSMGPFAGAQPLSSTQSVDSLMVPLKVLTMGRKAATDSNVSRRLARQHKIERWFMQETLAKRKPRRAEAASDLLVAQERVRRIPKFKHLTDASYRAVVSDIRPPDPADFLQSLRHDAQQAVLDAAKTTSIPPGTSTFAQMRRWHLEHSFAGDRFTIRCQPNTRQPPLQRPLSVPSLGGVESRTRSESGTGAPPAAPPAVPTNWVLF